MRSCVQLGVGPRLCTMYLDTHILEISNGEMIGEAIAKEIKNKGPQCFSLCFLKNNNKLQKLFDENYNNDNKTISSNHKLQTR